MKTKKYLLYVAAGCLCATISLPSCGSRRQDAGIRTETLRVDTTLCLDGSSTVPSCKLKLDFAYLQPSSEDDSLTDHLNRRIIASGFGGRYGKDTPEAFVRHFTADYLEEYRTDVEPLYKEDRKQGTATEDLPAWYNYEYEFTTRLEEGAAGVINYTIQSFMYTGGAHPNTVIQCLNFDRRTGRVLPKEEVFDMNRQTDICGLLLQAIIEESNRKMETDTITSLQGLQTYGILLDGTAFIPDNFLLQKEAVTFVYNNYDIAPYSAGRFILSLPNSALQPYFKNQN